MNEPSLKAKLKNLARELNRSFNELWFSLVTERFLARLAATHHSKSFVFKGGVLLAQYLELGRETKDLDFLVRSIRGNRSNFERAISEIAATNLEDDFLMKLASFEELPHEHMRYPGFHARVQVEFGKLKAVIPIDMGVGEAHQTKDIQIHGLSDRGEFPFRESISLLAYTPELIFADKIQASVRRAEKNSRMKDYLDMWHLVESGILDEKRLKDAIAKTFAETETNLELLPFEFSQAQLTELQSYWSRFLRSLDDSGGQTPRQIEKVVQTINDLLVSILGNSQNRKS